MSEAESSLLDFIPSERALFVVHDGEPTGERWEDIFDSKRYTRLRAVSYVSSPRFLSKAISGFNRAEVILGIDSPNPCAPYKT